MLVEKGLEHLGEVVDLCLQGRDPRLDAPFRPPRSVIHDRVDGVDRVVDAVRVVGLVLFQVIERAGDALLNRVFVNRWE